jgi:hypothetical protein
MSEPGLGRQSLNATANYLMQEAKKLEMMVHPSDSSLRKLKQD